MKKVIQKIIILYQKMFSPVLYGMGVRCRFHPSCSEYANLAIKDLPIGSAILLIAARILKCGPWHPGGVDLLPNTKGIR